MKLKHQKGFTIVELLIATAVLSMLLVLVSVVMVNIGRLYYKGINQTRVQDNVRSVTDEIAQHLKLGDQFFYVTSGNEHAYCIGDLRYTYVLNRQIGTDSAQYQSPHVLWRDQNPNPGSCSSSLPNLGVTQPSADGAEMIAPKSRLLALNITGSSPYMVQVAEAYGDNDLLCDTGSSGDCASAELTDHMKDVITGAAASSGPIRCKGNIGNQYCATANLQTTVTRRLPGS